MGRARSQANSIVGVESRFQAVMGIDRGSDRPDESQAEFLNRQNLIVTANASTDDGAVAVEFDATAWFESADATELKKLVKCNFGGDLGADAVANFFEEHETAALFEHVYANGNDTGFECYVNEEEALAWLNAHQPALMQTWRADGLVR